MFQENISPRMDGERPRKVGPGRMLPKSPPGSDEHWNHVKNNRRLTFLESRSYPRGAEGTEMIRVRLLKRTRHGDAEHERGLAINNLKKIKQGLRRTTSDSEKHATYQAQLPAAERRVQEAQQAVLRTNDLMHPADRAQHRF